MRTVWLLGALLAAQAAPAGAQSLLAEADEKRADLSELLRLSGSFWARIKGDGPEENTFEGVDAGLRRFGVTPEIGGVVSGSGIGLGFTHVLWHDDRNVIRWNALGTTEGYFQLALVHDATLDEKGRLHLRSGILHRDLAQEDFFGLGLESRDVDRTDY